MDAPASAAAGRVRPRLLLLVLLLLGEQAAAAAWGGLHGSGAVTVGRHSGHGARRQRRGHEVALSDPFDDPRTRVSQWVDAAEDLGGRAMRKLLQYIPGVSLPSGNATVERGVSVVIMNWRRPKNVQQIVERYVGYSCVAEVIVLMCRDDTRFEFDHPKVRTVNATQGNAQLGLSVRFAYCRHAASSWVLIQDDDVWTTAESILYMMHVKQLHPGRLVGCCGRDWRGLRPEYDPTMTDPGPTRIMLTIMMLVERPWCDAFFDYSHLMEDVARTGVPYWNGEDIMFSLVSFKLTHRLPLALSFRWGKMSDNHTGVHQMKGHLEYRDGFLRAAVHRLGLGLVPAFHEERDAASNSSLVRAAAKAVSALHELIGATPSTREQGGMRMRRVALEGGMERTVRGEEQGQGQGQGQEREGRGQAEVEVPIKEHQQDHKQHKLQKPRTKHKGAGGRRRP